MDPLAQPQPPLLAPPQPVALGVPQEPSKPAVTRNARACTVCRQVKMKCVGAEDGQQPCQRCKRSNLQCVFEKHRRGRKPGSKLSEASRLLRRIDKAPDDQGDAGHDVSHGVHVYHDGQPVFRSGSYSDQRTDSRLTSSGPGPLPGIHHLASPPGHHSSPGGLYTPSAPRPLSPSRHILREPDAGHGPSHIHREPRNTYLGTILNPLAPGDHPADASHHHPHAPAHHQTPDPARLPDTPPPLAYGVPPAAISTRDSVSRPPLPPRFPVPTFADPVSAGILSESDAATLLELIFKNLNPFLMLFDPSLHSLQYIRERSPFLFACILTAACKFWRPESHKACLDLTRALIPLAFEKQWRSVEVVQAFLFLTFYPEANDDRSWSYIGYACRMAVELGMHRLGGGVATGTVAERRNAERTYLVLFIQERTLSMLAGKQTMLPDSDLTRAAGVWYTDPAVLGGPSIDDVMICAIVELRRIVMETYELCKSRAGNDHNDIDLDVLLNTCNNKLSDWMELWHTALQRAGGQMFHFSVLCLYRLQTRLYLNGIGLDAALNSRDGRLPGVQTISRCYTSGLSALLIVAKELAPIRLLQFTHHLLTLMTAYCAVFLLRLLPIGEVYNEFPQDHSNKTLGMVKQTADAYGDADSGNRDAAEFFRALLASEVAPPKDDDSQTAVDSAGPASEKRTPTASASRTPSPRPKEHPALSTVRIKPNPAFEFPAGPAVPVFPFRTAQPPGGALSELGKDPQDAAQMADVFWQKTFAQLGFGRVEPVPEQV
ncbi:hypothetical protein AURDEDRAFT_180917 [Auricularia subglabra TFB-10046 SS5]|nr:hypothetical protein AURDEDRAFT_180917 [Auricularia subglabra TFB-10046 SS5]